MWRMCFHAVTALSLLGAPLLAGADDVRERQWYLRFLQIDRAHEISRGAGVVVALMDTGVDKHPDLAGSVLPGIDYWTPGGDGRTDTHGHGTKMAGLIAGNGRILGIAPEAKILPVRLEFAKPDGTPADTEEPVRWAVDHGAKVISMSIGGDDPNPAWARAIQYALSRDVVVVAAVNNVGQGTRPSGLASVPGVVVVSGVDQRGEFDSISLSGDEVVVAAPSSDCWTTRINGEYGGGSGTSNSAAIVSGVVALIRSRFPDLSGPGVVARLTETADDRGAPGRDKLYGYGVVNPLRALGGASAGAAVPIEAKRPGWLLPAAAGGLLLLVAVAVGVARRRARAKPATPGH